MNICTKEELAIFGGSPVRSNPFPARKTMGEEEKRAVLDVMDSDVLSAFIGAGGKNFLGGTQVRAFEDAWKSKYGFKHAVSVNSWTSGLVACIGAVGVGPGDEVIVPPFTMSASAVCPLFYGAVPVFADIDPETFCIDPASVERAITPRTRAIVAVHLFGHPADMDAILKIAKPRGIAVIEDAAQAPGAYYKGRAVGAIGDIGGFSLNFHKHIHTGEGGMIVTQDEKLARKCQMIRNHGENACDDLVPEDCINVFGGNMRLTELQSAIGIVQLKKLEAILKKRNELAEYFSDRLRVYPGITPQSVQPDCTHSRYIFSVKLDEQKLGCSRSQFVKAVAAELPVPQSSECVIFAEGYMKPLYRGRLFQDRLGMGRNHTPLSDVDPARYSDGICPVAERAYEKELIISPLVREPLEKADLDDVVRAIDKVVNRSQEVAERLAGVVAGTPQTLVDVASK